MKRDKLIKADIWIKQSGHWGINRLWLQSSVDVILGNIPENWASLEKISSVYHHKVSDNHIFSKVQNSWNLNSKIRYK